jgi:L,D-transpeptidase catalytic domain
MRWPRWIALLFLFFLTVDGFCRKAKTVVRGEEVRRLGEKAFVQKSYLSSHGFNTDICFLADMRLPSGKNRIFVYDLKKDSILLAGLVAHGCGAGDRGVAAADLSLDL